jgi:hypothetical protein
MSFFKKIFSSKSPATGERDPSEDKNENPGTQSGKTLVPRAERVEINPQIAIQCENLTPGNAFLSPTPIVNISLSGAALDVTQFIKVPEVGARLTLRMTVNGQVFDVESEVVRVTSSVIGVFFQTPSLGFLGALKNYLIVEISALKLAPVASEHLKPVPVGMPHWLAGEKKSGVYFVENQGEVLEFNLSFFGNIVEYRGSDPVRFGRTYLDLSGNLRDSSSQIKWDDSWSQDTLDLACRFIDALPVVEARHKQFFASIVRQIPHNQK